MVSIVSSSVAVAGESRDLRPRDHHLVQPPPAELDDRVDHLLLFGLEDALLAAALDEQLELLGAHHLAAVDVVDAEQPRHGLR